jgi:hypothetical protein
MGFHISWKSRIRTRASVLCVRRDALRTNPGKSRRAAELVQLFASYLIEKYIAAATEKPDFRSGLPILAASQSAGLSARTTRRRDFSRDARGASGTESGSLFSGVQAGDLSPLQFVPRERITLAQPRALLCKSHWRVGYTSPSHFTKVFRRVTGVTPVEFRSSL